LKAELPSGLPRLQATLAHAANNAIDEIENKFGFWISDNPAGNPAEEVLRNVQYQYDFLRALAREGIEGTVYRPGESEAVRNVKNRLDASWRQRFRTIPIEKWRSRACRLISDADPMAALASYQALRNDMAYLEEALDPNG